MSYRDEQCKWALSLRNEMFDNDPGGGLHNGRAYDFVLKNPKRNLYNEILNDAIEYFKKYNIEWHSDGNNQTDTSPEGHLLSSNIACINHLFPLRQNQNFASLVLKNIDQRITNAEIIEDGYVAFEIVGEKNHLGERSHKRGALSTSVDAVMIGRKSNGKNILVLIEWKYTECYGQTSRHKPAHDTIYKPLLEKIDCPINIKDIQENNFDALYYEPFYQLMRQTLLGWKMIENNEYNCDEYLHLHVIPEGNKELLDAVTSPLLRKYGNSLSEAWKGILKNPNQYKIISPKQFLDPLKNITDLNNLLKYLNKRYWK